MTSFWFTTMSDERSKLFSMVVKALPSDGEFLKSLGLEGQMVVDGPFSSHKPDFEDEVITKAAILSGVNTFNSMGKHVDWDHQYRVTKDPKFLIGQGVHHYQQADGTPNLVTRLYADNPIAQNAWSLLKANGELGYSVEGRATKRSSDRKTIHAMDIFRVTLAPSPMGMLETRVKPLGVLKSLMDEVELDVAKGWVEAAYMEDVCGELEALNGELPPIKIVERLILKSYTTGTTYVPTEQMLGATALRRQAMVGPKGEIDPEEEADHHLVQPLAEPRKPAPKTKVASDALLLKGVASKFISDMRHRGYDDDAILRTWDKAQRLIR
jgi:hypothetical protein